MPDAKPLNILVLLPDQQRPDWLGVTLDALPMPGMDATSLRPLLEGRTRTHRTYLVAGLHQWRTVVEGDYKLVCEADGEPMLFDLKADPWEDRNVALHNPDRVAHMPELQARG